MFGFTMDGERVGEAEYSRMLSKEMLKEQVSIISETASNGSRRTFGAKKQAKRILRILSTCSLMSLCEGQSQITVVEALGQRLWVFPLVFVTLVVTLAILVCMVPENSSDREHGEPEPYPHSTETWNEEREPLAEPLTFKV